MSEDLPPVASSRLVDRLADVEARIERACRRAGRTRSEVTLVAVSKTHPVSVIREAMAAGVNHFGENRVQEWRPKAEAIPGLWHGGPIVWHMIGHVQRNKAREVVEHADVVHSLDSLRLAEEFHARARDAGRRLPCFVQVNVSGESSKSGLAPEEITPLLVGLAPFETLEIVGMMTLAAPTSDSESVRPQFRTLRQLLHRARSAHPHLAGMYALSMGMSGDFEVAIEEGATHVRIGSALFGERG
jgi:hypothetical protein